MMLVFLKAPTVIHVLLKLVALLVVASWAQEEVKNAPSWFKWKDAKVPDRVVTALICVIITFMIFCSLYSQSVPW